MALRSLVTLVALALLVGALPTTPAAAADEDRYRDYEDAAMFELASGAVQAASDRRAGTTWRDLDGATRVLIETNIEHIKFLRRDLVRQMRRDLRGYRGAEHRCERDEIRRQKRLMDARLERHLKALRHVRGDHRKAFTKLHRFVKKDVIKPLGKAAKQALRMSLDELALMYLSGGAVDRTAIRAVFKRNAVRVAREEGRAQLRRTADRVLLGRRALPTDEALAEACRDQEEEPAGTGTGATTSVGSAAEAFASGAWQLDQCTGSAQFSLDGFMPAPPYSQPYTLVRFDWPDKTDVMLTYFATSGDPLRKHPVYSAVMDAGCADMHNDIANNCGPALPLVFTQALEATQGQANNRVVKPGTYTLVVEAKGACIYETDNGDWDGSYPYPSSIPVTATIEHYQAGETAPYTVEGPLTASVPFWSEDPFAIPVPNPANRRVIGTLTWEPPEQADGSGPWDDEPSPGSTPDRDDSAAG